MIPQAAQPVVVRSETLSALMAEGRREWSITEPWFYLLLVLIALDVALGLLCSIKAKRINSSASFNGLRKKAAMLLMVAAMAFLDPFIPGLNISVMITTAFVGMELLSLTENSATLGLPIPTAITDVLSKLREADPQKVQVVASIPIDATVKNPASEPVPTTTADDAPRGGGHG